MKAPKDKSQAKSMVMTPLYRVRVVKSAKQYARKSKHRNRDDF